MAVVEAGAIFLKNSKTMLATSGILKSLNKKYLRDL